MGVRTLTRPIRRRVGRLVVTITADGVELRGYRRRRLRRFLSWSQIASLSDAAVQPLLAGDESAIGNAELLALKADPAAVVETKAKPIAEPEPIAAEPEPIARNASTLESDYWPCACVRGKLPNRQIKLNHKSRKRCRVCKATRPDELFEGAHNAN